MIIKRLRWAGWKLDPDIVNVDNTNSKWHPARQSTPPVKMLISVIYINITYGPAVHGQGLRQFTHFVLFMGILQSHIDSPFKENHLSHRSCPLNALMLIMIHQLFPLTLFRAHSRSYTQKHSSTAKISINNAQLSINTQAEFPHVCFHASLQSLDSCINHKIMFTINGVPFILFPCFFPGLQVACMQLINALVTSPDDLDFRIHLRNEFLRCGLKKILPVSYEDNTAELLREASIWFYS